MILLKIKIHKKKKKQKKKKIQQLFGIHKFVIFHYRLKEFNVGLIQRTRLT